MTIGIIAVTAAFYVLASIPALRETLFANLAQINALVAAGEWWRIFTPVLLHSGSLTDFPFGQLHIVFNMWALWVLGPQIERGVGRLPFLGAYIASAGVGGAFLYFMGDPTSAAVGASGAIFGLFGIWLNWALRRRNTMQGRLLLRQILVLLAVNAALPFMIRGIAWEAHLGGLIAGFVIGELWARVRGERTNAVRFGITMVVAALAVVAVLIL